MAGNAPAGERTLAELASDLWRGRFYVFSGLFSGAMIAFFLLLLAVPHGGAQMIIAPAVPIDLAVVSSQALRDRSGLGLAAQSDVENQNFVRFQALANGAAAASILLRSEEIRRGLSKDRAFKFSKPEHGWTPARLAQYTGQRVSFDPVGETSLRRMRYMHPDPEFAALFLQRLHSVADGLIRYNTRREINGRIEYLRGELEKSRNPEHRRALADLLMEQERLRMLVSIDQPYAAAVVEPAFVVAGLRWPDAALVFPVFACAGALAGLSIFFLKQSMKAQTRPLPQSERLRGARRPARVVVEQNNEGARARGRDFGFFSDAAE